MINHLKFSEPDYSIRHAGYTEPGYYFWDENHEYCYGPYETEEDAQAAENEYIMNLEMLCEQQKETVLTKLRNNPLFWWSLDCVCWFLAGIVVGFLIWN